MSSFTDRGYFVKESGPIYYTKDMDKTVRWFEDVLGWYGDIVDRNDTGMGTYGFVADMPKEFVSSPVLPFQGIHLWYGEPLHTTIALIQVRGIASLYNNVKKNNWNKIDMVQKTEWSSGVCNIVTPDGSTLTFFE